MLLLFVAVGCSKDDYYRDSGVSKAEYDGTILQYLEEKSKQPYSLFDSLLTIVKLAELDQELSTEKITLFAPTDPSIGKAMKALNVRLYNEGKDTVANLSQVNKEVWRKLLRGYMIEGDYGMVDFAQIDTLDLRAYGGRLYQTKDQDHVLNVGVVYHDLINGDIRIKYQGNRQLLVSYIPDLSQSKVGLINGYISTSNIQPTNGRIHVIRYSNHTFGFASDRFTSLALEYGINYND